MAPNPTQPPARPLHHEWTNDGRQHLPASILDGGLDNEASHCQMVAILAEWRTGSRTLLALILMSSGLAGCTVGSDFVAPSPPRGKAYIAGNSSVLQVLDAQRLLLLAELSLVQARAERLHQTVNLFVAAGGGLKASPEPQ
jgi:hypothetical protein